MDVGQTRPYENEQRLAMRRCGVETCGEAEYLHGDHLGSVSLATDADGNLLAQARYAPYGQVRWSGDTIMPTKFAFTGQRADDGFGLMDYHARFYSPYPSRMPVTLSRKFTRLGLTPQ